MMILMTMYLNEKYSLYYYIGTTVLYALLLCIFNGISVRRSIDYKQEIKKTFVLPGMAAAIMGIVAFGVYQGLYYLIKMNIVALIVSIAIACIVYFVLIIKIGAVTESELRSMPKGHLLVKIAKKCKLLCEEAELEKVNEMKEKKKKKTIISEYQDMEDEDYWLDE